MTIYGLEINTKPHNKGVKVKIQSVENEINNSYVSCQQNQLWLITH